MSFFGSLFGELIPGGDCSSIEQDPHADPFDKEVCQQFRRFNDAFGRSLDIERRSPEDEGDKRGDDPQSQRDAILNRPDSSRGETPQRRQKGFRHYYRNPRQDEDLDERVRRDPGLLDKVLGDEAEDTPKSHHHSSYSSVVITTKPDGSVEERRTVVDSDGNEKTTVTYSDGRQKRETKKSRLWDRIL